MTGPVWPLGQDPALLLMETLLNCLQTSTARYPNAPGQICLRVGSEIAHDLGQWEDLCCDGLGYVALGDTYPSSDSFPEQDIIRQANTACAPPAWAQAFKVGIARCVPVSNEVSAGFEPPSCAQWTAAGVQNVYDSAALRATACCFRTFVRGINSGPLFGMSLVIERQVQGNPTGGCVERTMTITAQFPNCDC
jgi:hypothetical protein